MKKMKKAKIFVFLVLSMILAVAISAPLVNSQGGDVPNGPYPDTLIIFLQDDESTVIPKIEVGDMDGWLWWLTPENTEIAEASSDVELIEAYGLNNEFFVNPLETTDSFNPFSIREVREALNWLIDRDYIVNELWFGRGSPRWTTHATIQPDYARVADFMKQLESANEYDFERAKSQIFTALEDAGAYLQDETWHYNGTVITAKLLIRIEDERRPTGDYLANQLEAVGFTVDRNYQPSSNAYQLWGAFGPTKAGDWHIYTAGWIMTAVNAYDDSSPWGLWAEDNAPLYEEYTPSPLLQEALDKLNNGDYADMEERNELVKSISEFGMVDGGHIQYIDQLVSFPYSADLGPFIYYLFGGDQNFWAIRSMRRADPGGTLRLGAIAMFIEGYNPIGGFSWLYEAYEQWAVQDFGVWYHPHTGIFEPVRSEFEVETGGPDGTVSVPEDAWMYNVTAQEFQEVGPDVEAVSKISFNMTLGEWHHGEAITAADILMNIAEVIEFCTPGTDIYDAVAAQPNRQAFVNSFVAVELGESDNLVDIYLNYWHPDDGNIAYYADVFPPLPWELKALSNDVVSQQLLAWSEANADLWGVDQLDFTKGSSLPILLSSHGNLSAANYIPPQLEGIVTESEAQARWAAQNAFYAEWGHFWVSQGMYVFDNADTDAFQVTMQAFRDYPFKADKWDDWLTVKVPEVAVSSVPTTVVPGLDTTFNFTVTVAGELYDKADMSYLITDATGELVGSGTASNQGNGTFTVDLTSEDTAPLVAGSYKLLTITVGEEAALPVSEEVVFTATSEAAFIQGIVAETTADIDNVEESIATLDQSLNTAISDVRNTQYISIALSIVRILVAGGAIFLRRK
jgi:peptide/nickel transport system substrate-binding protein